MRVQVLNDLGEVIWCHGDDCNKHRSGMTSQEYLNDGTQRQIIGALILAFDQASFEELGSNNLN